MLDITLAKRLQESGYPPLKGVTEYHLLSHINLGDLIDAFHSFAKLEHTGKGDIEWFAEAWNEAWDKKYRGEGETPVITVINLWLVMNETPESKWKVIGENTP